MDKSKSVSKSKRIELLNVTKQQAEQFVRTALDQELLIISSHAREEMVDDGINEVQIRGVLKQNRMVEEPTRDLKGRWSCRFEGYHSGQGIAVPVGFDCRHDGTIVVVITTFSLNNYR